MSLRGESVYLSRLLRHTAAKVGLQLRSDGYAKVDDVLALPKCKELGLTLESIRTIVESNDKQRFKLHQDDKGDWLIRANQGHSSKQAVKDLALTPLRADPALMAVHGTSLEAWKVIRRQGLKRGKRMHIHFGADALRARESSEVLIYLDVVNAIEDGIPLFVADNGVILSEGIGPDGVIPPTYFIAVVLKATGEPFDLDFLGKPPQ